MPMARPTRASCSINRSRPLAAVILIAASASLVSCGGDGRDGALAPEHVTRAQTRPQADIAPSSAVPIRESSDPMPRSTPEQLLTSYIELVYAQKDSALYAAMLDRRFQFHFLPADADSLRDILGSDDFWKKTLDLKSTGAMFRNPEVGDVSLNIVVSVNTPYLGSDCVGCREIEATVSLRVTVNPGPNPLVLAVDSPQTFVTKSDWRDPSQWVLFRQVDVENVVAPNGAVEGFTWGGVKGIYVRQ